MNVGFGDYFGHAIYVAPEHNAVKAVAEITASPMAMVKHSVATLPLYLAGAGVFTAWLFYLIMPSIPAFLHDKLGFLHRLLNNKYGFDDFNQLVFAGGSVGLGRFFWKKGDQTLIDGAMVNGSANNIGGLSGIARFMQTGFLFHYAFAMILGLLAMLSWFLFT